MVRDENIHSKLAALRRYLGLLERFRSQSIEEIRSDPYLQGAMERYLFLAVQACIDLAEMVCKFRGLGKAEGMSRSFRILAEAGLITEPLSNSLGRMVGFRNALVHGYENLDDQIVEDVLKVRLDDLEAFAGSVERAV